MHGPFANNNISKRLDDRSVYNIDEFDKPEVTALKPNKVTDHWRLVEKAIVVLERMLSPDSVIEHDIRLPELATGTLRQCDVTIRTGRPPRQTLTIVEVQDRNRDVDIGTYEGWCSKREKLGAQHLICVSVSGFPSSVRQDAALRGDTVRLMTLLDGQPPQFLKAPNFLLNMQVLHKREAVTAWDDRIPAEAQDQRCESRIFRADGETGLLSLMEIADRELRADQVRDFSVQHQLPNIQIRRYRLDFSATEHKIWLDTAFGPQQLQGVFVEDRVENVHQTLPIHFLAYEQIDYRDPLAWLVLGTGKYDGHEFTVKIAFARDANGRIAISRSEMTAIPGLKFVSNGLELV